jgi:hypothetical protein
VKKVRIKKIILITIGFLIAIGIILGGLAIGGVLKEKEEAPLPPKTDKPEIKIPTNYQKYEEKVQNGQQSNILKIIHIPL